MPKKLKRRSPPPCPLNAQKLERRELLAEDMPFVPPPVCLASPRTVASGSTASLDPPSVQSSSNAADTSAYLALNLARFQQPLVDSVASGSTASEATDGIVSNESRWVSENSTGTHWMEVRLRAAYPVGSAQIVLGSNSSNNVSSFDVQYHDGSAWQTIVSVSDDNPTDHNLVFPQTIDNATRFRLRTTANQLGVKEFVLLPPNGPQGYPLGTAVDLNPGPRRASRRSTVSFSNHAVNAAVNAVDWRDYAQFRRRCSKSLPI